LSVAVDPRGSYVYVANFFSNTVSAYSIGTTGALTSIGAPVAAGFGPFPVAVDPTGNFVYVANQIGNNVSAYSIGATGVLTPIGVPVAAGSNPRSVAISRTACTGPVLSHATASPSVLWPPNDQFVPVAIDYEITDGCDPQPACSLSVTVTDSDGGVDNLANSYIVVNPKEVELQAARHGGGAGRTYSVEISCKDKRQLSSSASVTVTVPHDQGH
jgi:hypothetical protein